MSFIDLPLDLELIESLANMQLATPTHIQTQAMCSAMPLGDTAEIILTSKLIELLNGEELESVIAHEVAHFYYQHALYPQANS